MDRHRERSETWRSNSLVMIPLSAGAAILVLIVLSLAVDSLF